MTEIDGQAMGRWPELPLDPWRPTYRALHMWTQVVGKTLLGCTSPQNHFWHCALRVSARGLESASPLRQGERSVEVELDLVDHALVLRGDGGRTAELPLVPRSVHAFHDLYLGLLRGLGIETRVWTTPVEVPDPVPFDRDDAPGAYDPEAASRFWQVLRRCDAALKDLAIGFLGKQSPVHFYWGTFDLAATRFSGRRAPERPGADPITREAYSHEVISHGWWPGGVGVNGPAFYSYTAPEPAGLAQRPVRPGAAFYHPELKEFILMYDAVRNAESPADTLMEFLQSTYDAGADLAGLDRDALEVTKPAA